MDWRRPEVDRNRHIIGKTTGCQSQLWPIPFDQLLGFDRCNQFPVNSLLASILLKRIQADVDLWTGERWDTCVPGGVVCERWSPASDICVKDVLLIFWYGCGPALTVSSFPNVQSSHWSHSSSLFLSFRALINFFSIFNQRIQEAQWIGGDRK